jgi:tetratricopeptide (TPR) repeat protein
MLQKNRLSAGEWFLYGVAGFMFGGGVISLLALNFIAPQILAGPVPTTLTPASSFQQLPPAGSAPPSAPLIATQQLPVLLPTPTSNPLFVQAELASEKNDFQKVIDLLEPKLSSLTRLEEQKEALHLLGDAEYQLGHYQLAAGYFEKLYQISPTTLDLLYLATAYDDGGNQKKALEMYLQILAANDPNIPPDLMKVVQYRVNILQSLLTGATLTPLPLFSTPTP